MAISMCWASSRALASQALQELAPAHAGHPDVRDDDVEIALPERPQCVAAVGDSLTLDAAAAEELEQRVAQRGLVVDDQYRDGARGRGRRRGRLGERAAFPARVARQGDHERRAAPRRGVDRDATAVLARDAVADRQTESRPDALRLGGEERVEDLGPDFGRDSR